MTTLASLGIHRDTTHIGFADEAYWNTGKFRSIACLSSRVADYDEIERRLCNARCVAGATASELKWNALTDHERRRDANSVLKTLVELVSEGKLRVDILVWDHTQTSLNDEERLRRGYHSILRFTTSAFLRGGTEDSTIWTYAIHSPDNLSLEELWIQLEQDYSAEPISAPFYLKRATSALNYSVEVADIIAGLSAYSCEHASDFQTWVEYDQPGWLETEAASWENRFPVIADLQIACQGAGLELSLGDQLRDQLREQLDSIPMGEITEVIISLAR